jgi:hypothetical protein
MLMRNPEFVMRDDPSFLAFFSWWHVRGTIAGGSDVGTKRGKGKSNLQGELRGLRTMLLKRIQNR